MLLEKIKTHTNSNDSINNDDDKSDKVKATHNIPNAECELMSKSQ